MSGERVIFDRGARLYLGNLAMPVHASRDHRFLGFDGIEWLLIFGTTLLLGAIVTLSHLFDHSVGNWQNLFEQLRRTIRKIECVTADSLHDGPQ